MRHVNEGHVLFDRDPRTRDSRDFRISAKGFLPIDVVLFMDIQAKDHRNPSKGEKNLIIRKQSQEHSQEHGMFINDENMPFDNQRA
jgi:hypothetical protein